MHDHCSRLRYGRSNEALFGMAPACWGAAHPSKPGPISVVASYAADAAYVVYADALRELRKNEA